MPTRCRSLDGLIGCGRLDTLLVSGYSALEDLSALAQLPVTDLRLLGRPYAGGPVAKLATFDGAWVRRLAIKHRDLRTGLYTVPDSLPLTELVVDSPARSRSLLGVRRFPTLEAVSVLGPLSAAEVGELAELPKLRRLVLDLTGVEGADLSPLDALTAVEIQLCGVHSSDHETVRAVLPTDMRVEFAG
ncbi:hypothetical protein [Saccharothrix sp. NRRL B-16314]|uniref:hypothetical protein n=1 Tax=Saccharothrix sp. NRRL B-16314 TaxID=1463825 RepID=UPI00052714CB|nr:hypothetical protein [Saccharothrix sp. NRRL B-16314]